MKKYPLVLVATAFAALIPANAVAETATQAHAPIGLVFGMIALILLAAKLGTLVERIGQPAVLGEILIGLIFSAVALLGLTGFRDIAEDPLLIFLGELGVVILLFQIGLESDIARLRRVGIPALLVAIIGVVVPMFLGWKFIGPVLIPGLSEINYLFLGAALTATSVGITARVFQDLGKLQSKEAQIVLGAAVIDDVLGLLILAVVSGIATSGAASGYEISVTAGKAIIFLSAAIVLGKWVAKPIGHFLSKIYSGVGMKLGFALAFAFAMAAIAEDVGLAPIVGAFAAGLVLDPVVFSRFRAAPYILELREVAKSSKDADAKQGLEKLIEKYTHRHIDDLIEPVAHFLVPIFFVLTGMRVDLSVFANMEITLIALGVTAAAIFGKIIAGVAAGRGSHKLLVGIGMVPRGEVGLIFANVGKSLGVISDEIFAVVVAMVVITTLITPPLLAVLLRRQSNLQPAT